MNVVARTCYDKKSQLQHSASDDFAWFQKFADPVFVYEQQQARFLGIEVLRMSEADLLPFDYEDCGREIRSLIAAAEKNARERFASKAPDFAEAEKAAERLQAAGQVMKHLQTDPPSDAARTNRALILAERGFLLNEGLAGRPWYRYAIFAPDKSTGYSALALPAVSEAVGQGDLALTDQQLRALTAAIERVAQTLEQAVVEPEAAARK